MSRQLLTQFEQQNDGISSLLEEELATFLASLDLGRPEAARIDLFEYLPVLISEYGDIAATTAADFYDELRSVEGVPGRFSAPLAPVVADEVINGRLGFATRLDGPLFLGQESVLTGFLGLMSNEYALQPGRDTIIRAAHKDKTAYARVPEPGACKFCLMLASRGFVYSQDTVGDSRKFHGKCRCNAMPIWDETRARVEYGYDPERIFEQFKDAQ